jgi:hypothetical protein
VAFGSRVDGRVEEEMVVINPRHTSNETYSSLCRPTCILHFLEKRGAGQLWYFRPTKDMLFKLSTSEVEPLSSPDLFQFVNPKPKARLPAEKICGYIICACSFRASSTVYYKGQKDSQPAEWTSYWKNIPQLMLLLKRSSVKNTRCIFWPCDHHTLTK